MSELFGELNIERDVQGIIVCRDIVKTILEYGVTQQQLLYIIKFLSMELEDGDAMRDLAIITNDLITNANDGSQFSKIVNEA